MSLYARDYLKWSYTNELAHYSLSNEGFLNFLIDPLNCFDNWTFRRRPKDQFNKTEDDQLKKMEGNIFLELLQWHKQK